MKIKFWGTAAGLAEKGRYCTSVLIETSGEYYILDFGAPVEYLIANDGIDMAKIKAGFITHMHADHADSLTSFAKLYAQFTNFIYAPASVDMYMPAGIDAFLSWLEALNLPMSDRMSFNLIREGTIYDNGKLKVSAIRTEHLGKDKPSYAFVFEADGKKVLFTGDLTDDFHDFPIGDHYDLVVCELAHGEMNALKKCIKDSDCNRVIFYHMSSDPLIIEKVKVNRLSVLEESKETLGFTYELAYDGFETEV